MAAADAVPAADFYPAPRPPPEPGLLVRAARTPIRLSLVLLGLGVAGVLVQRSFLSQLVVGAPVFEEMGKFGLALLLASLVRVTHPAGLLPFAWLVGAGFGMLEHYASYPDERLGGHLLRVAFHMGTTGLSMAVYAVVASADDVRVRWASPFPSMLVHWANNFGVLVLALLGVLVPGARLVATAWSVLATTAAFALALFVLARPALVRARLAREVARLLRTAA